MVLDQYSVVSGLGVCDAVYGDAIHVIRRVAKEGLAVRIAADVALLNCQVQHVFNGFAFFNGEGVRNQSGAVNRDLQRC